MTEQSTQKAQSDVMSGVEAEKLLRIIGLALSNTSLYGASHSVSKKACEDAFKELSESFKKYQEVAFSINENGIMANSATVDLRNRLIKTFVDRLKEIDLNSFSIKRGISQEKFEALMKLFNTKPEEIKKAGGFATAAAGAGLDSVRVTTVSYVQVTEDEVVLSKDDMHDQSMVSAVNAAAESAAVNVDTILAFLRGDVSTTQKGVVEGMQSMATDADKLADLIMKSAEVQQGAVDVDGGETFAEIVVGCLKRAYDGVSQSPEMKTQKGKKKFTKTLMLLEQEVLEKMRAQRGVTDIEAEQIVTEAIEEMADDLTIDALAEEYMKKRNAIEANEKRILRFIKSKGAGKITETDLLEKLKEGGLSIEGWHELMIKSGIGGGSGMGIGKGGGGGMAAVGHLAMLLEHLEETIIKKDEDGKTESGKEAAGKLEESLREVSHEVDNLVVQTEKKIENLVQKVKAEDAAEEAEEKGAAKQQAPKMTRKQLLEFLAEIVQELCQPLVVIGCSIDMIASRSLGEITDAQSEMLKLAVDSGAKLQKLINKLLEISGLPATLQPDTKIQASVYNA